MSHKYQSLLEGFQHQVSTRPKANALLIPNGTKYDEINFQDFDIIINKYASYWNKQLMNENLDKNSAIGYLAQSGPEYLFNSMALWKLGFQILFLSPRNSEPALIHLLQETKSRILIYDPQLSKISENVQNEINSQRPQSFNIFQLPNNLKNLKDEKIDHFAPVLKSDENPYEQTIAIFHSSGSTSFPKLVPLSNRYLLKAAESGQAYDIILSTAPLFHVYGFLTALRSILGLGLVHAFPIVAGSIPLANEILHSLKQSKARILYTLPATLEQIHKNYPDEIKTLLNLKFIFYGGAALLPQVGEQLAQSGVKIQNIYGLTETGPLMKAPENLSPDIPWNAMKLIVPESDIKWRERNDFLDGAKELVIKKGSPILANIKGNTDNGDYGVGDLFIEAKKGSGLYLLLGRVDDTLIHTTGEKTNPIPMEDTIRLNQYIKHAVVVGHNRPFNCLLIELDFDRLKNTPFLEITKSIFDSVHQANINCPSHSRIFDEMVYILPFEGKMLPRTMKNNIQRKRVEMEFKEEIKVLYDNLVNRKVVSREKSFSDNQWSEDSVKATILSSLKLAIGNSFLKITEYETSFFALGLDSLSATKLRAILQNKYSFIDLPYDVIFEHNTVQNLTHYLMKELSNINVSIC